jgi:hypothetical protein
MRLAAIAAAAERIKAKSFTIDGEAVVLGPDGLSRFDEPRRREAAHSAIDGTYRSGPCSVWVKVAIPPASPCSGSGARSGIGDRAGESCT